MTILLSALLVVGLVIANPSPAAPGDGERHSGTVLTVEPSSRTLVLNELVENGRPRQLQVRVPEGAPVFLSERIPDEQVSRLEATFAERRIDFGEVRPGDFVVVEGSARGGSATAGIVVITLRGGPAETLPAASPGPSRRP